MIEIRGFNGKLNVDDNPYKTPKSDYIDALNITRDAEGDGQDEVVSNVVGNDEVYYEYELGINKTIGNFADKIKNRQYIFNWNSDGFHEIVYYDYDTDTINPLLKNIIDTNNEDILNFNPSYRINHIDIIYRDEGDLLFWTDGLNRPMFLNVLDAEERLYGNEWKLTYLTVARLMPLLPPVQKIIDDSSVPVNNFRNQVFIFRYRWVYKDRMKSTWSPYSKLLSPYNPDDLILNPIQTRNNAIDVTIQTGDTDVVEIELAGLVNEVTTMSDPFLIVTLNKAELGLADNAQCLYRFLNDRSYVAVDIREAALLYDYVPTSAFTQVLPNGNVLAYGAIKEGITFDGTIDAEMSVSTVPFTETTLALSVSSVNYGLIPSGIDFWEGTLGLNFIGIPRTGDVYQFEISTDVDSTYVAPSFTVSYTVLAGENLNTVLTNIAALINAEITFSGLWPDYPSQPTSPWIPGVNGMGYTATATTVPLTDTGLIQLTTAYSPYRITANWDFTYSSTVPSLEGLSNAVYKPNSTYSFGLVYFDEFGVTDGVHTIDAMTITTLPTFNPLVTVDPLMPVIDLSINNQPPVWARTYAVVRTNNLTIQDCVPCIGQSMIADAANKYSYINILSLEINTEGVPTYEFIEGDRVRIFSGVITSVGDWPIIDFVVDPTVDLVLRAGQWLKIPYCGANTGSFPIEMYTPFKRDASNSQVFYEFGENYQILNPGQSNRAHTGQTQSQIPGVRPATFQFVRGDFYIKRTSYRVFPGTLITPVSYWAIDRYISYLFKSKVTANGRAFIVDINAQENFFPTMIRFGGSYQQYSSVNNVNRFFYEDQDNYDRQNGDIKKMYIEGRNLFVFQKFDIGVVPVLQQIIKDVTGNPLQANSNELLNKIQYPYKGKYGIGDFPESFAFGKNGKYFVDSNKGVVVRLSLDGITPLSIVYKMNAFFIKAITTFKNDYVIPETGKPTVYGAFDAYTNKYIISLDEIVDDDDNVVQPFYTLCFLETRDQKEGFECFLSYYPENMGALNNLFISFKNGQLWKHNSSTYCNFYGTQYGAYVETVFNDAQLDKKSYLAIMQTSNTVWYCPTIKSQLNSYGSTPQQTSISAARFKLLEGQYNSAILRDANSAGGIINGDTIKGNYLKVKFQIDSASSFYYINTVSLKYNNSPLNSR